MNKLLTSILETVPDTEYYITVIKRILRLRDKIVVTCTMHNSDIREFLVETSVYNNKKEAYETIKIYCNDDIIETFMALSFLCAYETYGYNKKLDSSDKS